MKQPTPKPEGTWDFYGACAPDENSGNRGYPLQEIFTIGCFQWEPFARGRGTKKGKVQYRIKGHVSDPKPAFDAARAYCAKKNAQRSE